MLQLCCQVARFLCSLHTQMCQAALEVVFECVTAVTAVTAVQPVTAVTVQPVTAVTARLQDFCVH